MRLVARASAWLEEHRQASTLLLIVVLALGAAGVIYLNYRSDIREQAAVRLDELRLASRGMPPAELRAQLESYVGQFGSTPQGVEARLLLAEMELQRDSVEAAIRVLEPAVDLRDDPLGYNAAWMMAVAEEQRGNFEAAGRWYERLADAARHSYQRRNARAARAELHVYAGEYDAAEAIYAELADEPSETADEFYRTRLGEVRALAAAELPPPALPRPATDAASAPGASDGEPATGADGSDDPGPDGTGAQREEAPDAGGAEPSESAATDG